MKDDFEFPSQPRIHHGDSSSRDPRRRHFRNRSTGLRAQNAGVFGLDSEKTLGVSIRASLSACTDPLTGAEDEISPVDRARSTAGQKDEESHTIKATAPTRAPRASAATRGPRKRLQVGEARPAASRRKAGAQTPWKNPFVHSLWPCA